MKEEPYELSNNSADNFELEFTSDGPKGRIIKRIEFRRIGHTDSFELVFGNKTAEGKVDVYSVSDNGDRDKVLRTVADAVKDFLNVYPKRIVYFTGSTPVRTRLYQIAINHNFYELIQSYEIFAQQHEKIVTYRKNVKADAFYIVKRQ